MLRRITKSLKFGKRLKLNKNFNTPNSNQQLSQYFSPMYLTKRQIIPKPLMRNFSIRRGNNMKMNPGMKIKTLQTEIDFNSYPQFNITKQNLKILNDYLKEESSNGKRNSINFFFQKTQYF